MTTPFAPSQHPRSTDGKFSEKTGSAPDVSLRPLLAIPRFPGATQEDAAFAKANTFAGVDEVWKRAIEEVDAERDYLRYSQLTDAAAHRSRELREKGLAPTTPTALVSDGFFANPFARCENDAELRFHFDMMTEEVPGDGEASASQTQRWLNGVYEAHDARRAELEAAGVVSGKDTISE